MSAEQTPAEKERASLYRLKPSAHDALVGSPTPRPVVQPVTELTLPEPKYPQFPEKRGDVEPDLKYLPKDGNPYRARVTAPMVWRALRGWLVPYLRSRVLPGEFHPIIAYLFTEFKCNLSCHYCWAFDNRVKGMTEDTAVRAIDWLHETGCRVLALMGGEVLLRPQFAHKVVHYAANKGFFVYVPTNGRLMRGRDRQAG